MSSNDPALGLSTCLTDREMEILRLLVAGHTVKTIAARLGRSETSINERLRSARRKTGWAAAANWRAFWTSKKFVTKISIFRDSAPTGKTWRTPQPSEVAVRKE